MASADLGDDPTCLQCSFKIGKVVYDVTLTQDKLSWSKKGDAVEKSGMTIIYLLLSVWDLCNKLSGIKGKPGISHQYSKTCVKLPLKDRQNNDLNGKMVA